MDKIIQLRKVSQEKIKKQYELEDCDEDLVALAEKFISCNPSVHADKKKEAVKAGYLKKAAENSAGKHGFVAQELSEDELDAAAGGLSHVEDTMKDPFKDQ